MEKEEFDELKNRVNHLDKVVGKHIDITEKLINTTVKESEIHFNVTGKLAGVQDKIVGKLEQLTELTNSLSKILPRIFAFILILIFRNEIISGTIFISLEIVRLWNKFSENWQIALFSIFGTAIITFGGIFIDRKFFRKYP